MLPGQPERCAGVKMRELSFMHGVAQAPELQNVKIFCTEQMLEKKLLRTQLFCFEHFFK